MDAETGERACWAVGTAGAKRYGRKEFGHLVNQKWVHVAEAQKVREVGRTDPGRSLDGMTYHNLAGTCRFTFLAW